MCVYVYTNTETQDKLKQGSFLCQGEMIPLPSETPTSSLQKEKSVMIVPELLPF